MPGNPWARRPTPALPSEVMGAADPRGGGCCPRSRATAVGISGGTQRRGARYVCPCSERNVALSHPFLSANAWGTDVLMELVELMERGTHGTHGTRSLQSPLLGFNTPQYTLPYPCGCVEGKTPKSATSSHVCDHVPSLSPDMPIPAYTSLRRTRPIHCCNLDSARCGAAMSRRIPARSGTRSTMW